MPFLPSFGSWCQTGGSIRASFRNERTPRHGTIEPDSSGAMADGDSRDSYASRQERESLPVPYAVYVVVNAVSSDIRAHVVIGADRDQRHHPSACPPGTGSQQCVVRGCCFPRVHRPSAQLRRLVGLVVREVGVHGPRGTVRSASRARRPCPRPVHRPRSRRHR